MQVFKIPFHLNATSIDLCGRYVIVGCDNGDILCFANDVNSKKYIVIGQMASKVFSNLQTSVVICSDQTMCFAGTRKGSSELLAIDLKNLLNNSTNTSANLQHLSLLVSCEKHKDHKLRGFGSAASLISHGKTEYRIVCGLGIKNLHVWRYVCSNTSGNPPGWTCLYDIVTNGPSVECAEFVPSGLELMSKSTGANIRVWRLPLDGDAVEGQKPKPTFEEVPNTTDSRVIFEKYAYGGTYDLAVVRISATKDLNRDDICLPGSKIGSENDPSKRKRKLREIETIVGTSNGEHVLILCTDGGVLYFDTTASLQDKLTGVGPVIEVESLTYSTEVDKAWTLRQAIDPNSNKRDVMLLRSIRRESDCVIEISSLRDLFLMKQSSPQITISLTSSNLETSVNEEIFSSPPAFSAKTPKSKLSAVPITNSGRDNKGMSQEFLRKAENIENLSMKQTPIRLTNVKENPPSRPALKSITNLITERDAKSKVAARSLNSVFKATEKVEREPDILIHSDNSIRAKHSEDNQQQVEISLTDFQRRYDQTTKKYFEIGQAPKIRKIISNLNEDAVISTGKETELCMNSFLILDDWLLRCQNYINNYIKEEFNSFNSGLVFGPSTKSILSDLLKRQARIVLNQVQEVNRLMRDEMKKGATIQEALMLMKNTHIRKWKTIWAESTTQAKMSLKGAIQRDYICILPRSSVCSCEVIHKLNDLKMNPISQVMSDLEKSIFSIPVFSNMETMKLDDANENSAILLC